jgi:hypothetical protein
MGREALRRSIRLLWWVPAAPFVGFVVAEFLVSENWPLWQIAPLAAMLATPFARGAAYGVRALRRGHRVAWVPTLVHLGFAALALAMPISESLTG